MRSTLLGWIVGVVVCFLIICPHLRMFTAESVRYFTFWTRNDAIAMGAAVLLLGTAMFIAHRLTRAVKAAWLQRTADAIFVMVAGFAVVAIVHSDAIGQRYAWWNTACVAATVAVSVLSLVSLAPRMRRIPRVFRGGCLIVSPVVPLVWFHLLTYAEFGVSREALPPRNNPAQLANPPIGVSPDNVYLFIFDEWSYERTLAGPNVDREFPHLARLMRQATVYHDAHAPAGHTYYSTDVHPLVMDAGCV